MTVIAPPDARRYLNLYFLVLAVPLTAPLDGVTDATQVPFASFTVHERRASFFLPCLIVTFLHEPFFVTAPLFAVSS